ncbi:MAG: RsmG family class I SAM-dependent methyltransferase, partial [Thermovirgaceae bacterium]
KCSALAEIARELGLKNVVVQCARSEQAAAASRESFAVAVSRAVGHLGVVAEYMSPLVATGGRLLCFKGPKVRGEIGEIGPQWGLLGLNEPVLHPYSHGGRELFLALWEKSGHCPDRFPRRPGRAQKQHWWR